MRVSVSGRESACFPGMGVRTDMHAYFARAVRFCVYVSVQVRLLHARFSGVGEGGLAR